MSPWLDFYNFLDNKKQDQLTLGADYREEATSLLVELIEGSEETLNGIGSSGNTGTTNHLFRQFRATELP